MTWTDIDLCEYAMHIAMLNRDAAVHTRLSRLHDALFNGGGLSDDLRFLRSYLQMR